MSSLVGSIDSKNIIRDDKNIMVGRISSSRSFYDAYKKIASMNLEGDIFGLNEKKIARKDKLGNIYSESQIKDWFEIGQL